MKIKNLIIFLTALLLCLSTSTAFIACSDKAPSGSTESGSNSQTEEETVTPPVELADGDDLFYYPIEDGEAYAVGGLGLPQGAKRIEIPETFDGIPIVAICEEAFITQTHLESLVMPDSIKYIGSYAFSGCINLTALQISSGIEFIGEFAFEGCDKLKFTEYENALYLGNNQNPYSILVSASSTQIESCTAHSDTKIIYDYAFADCTEIDNIVIPNGIEQVGIGAFNDCLSLEFTRYEELEYLGNESNPYLVCVDATNRRNATSYTVHEDTKIIAPETFLGCSELKSIIIPNELISIGAYAFQECEKLEKIELDRISVWNVIDPEKIYPSTNIENDSSDFFDMLITSHAHCTWIRQN